MARYLSLHALGCLPKPAFATLCRSVFDSGGQARRIVAGQIGEKMLVEFEVSDADEASAWLRERKLTPVWIMRLDYESDDGSVREI